MNLNPKPLWLALALVGATAAAQPASTPPAVDAPLGGLAQAAQKALVGNPEVAARYGALRAANEAVAVARAGRGPTLDLEGSVGRTNDEIRSRSPRNESLTTAGAALNLTQTLWDGLGTQREIGRLGHEKLARYFEFVDASEQMALEVARAWFDVLRYRRLVQLAEDNYVQHRYAYLQIESRVKAGVGRGVDLEQAAARVALAESNLLNETSNLHDVSARYQRLVGEAPPAVMTTGTAVKTPAPTSVGATDAANALAAGVPANAEQLASTAVQRHAAISASIESLRAAREATKLRESLLQPRVEARVRTGIGHNFDAVSDQHRDTTAQIVLNWNLYDGGADRARIRQQVELLNQAAELRDKACRDARQTGLIAWNDTRKLADLLVYLDRNVLAIQKARDAYRQQFEIGQRSLLDLLNSENELYTARRSYANAEADLAIAQARAQAAMQQLGVRLGLRPLDTAEPAPEAADWRIDEDGPARCPALGVALATADKGALDERARQMAATAPVVVPPPAPASAPARAAPRR